MARIRTIKPEFWTDETIVKLPFQARLLFIGIWNFSDDEGAIEESHDRVRMQIFPNDPSIDVGELIDLLVASSLLDRFQSRDGRRAVQVRNWRKHQKIDNPSKSRILGEGYRKLAIPNEVRRQVAKRYGCPPGEEIVAECYFCGTPGRIHWFRHNDGRPSGWVTFPDLELDHLQPEVKGGSNSLDNLILSCRSCNRSRNDGEAIEWLSSRAFASPIEGYPSEGKGMEGNGRDPLRSSSSQTVKSVSSVGGGKPKTTKNGRSEELGRETPASIAERREAEAGAIAPEVRDALAPTVAKLKAI